MHRLAKNKLAFLRDYKKIYVEKNGIFLIKMIVEFDPIVQEYIHRIQAQETHYIYVGPKIQNELIQTLTIEVKNVVIAKVKKQNIIWLY